MSLTTQNKTIDSALFTEKRESTDITGNNQTLSIY